MGLCHSKNIHDNDIIPNDIISIKKNSINKEHSIKKEHCINKEHSIKKEHSIFQERLKEN